MEITIKNVIRVPGSSLRGNWTIPMYLIITDDDKLYIDNTTYHKYAKWIPADWRRLIGKRVEINVVSDSGYTWAEYKETKGQ